VDRDLSPYLGRERPEEVADEPPPPGQTTIATAALTIGLLLMGIQLWLLTIALDLYLAGEGGQVWQLALASGAIFLGGLMITGLLRRRPQVRRGPTGVPYRER
jgi:hypothetical protein